MNNVDFLQYNRDTLSLTRTLVVKIEAIAKRDNKALRESGQTVSDDKTTWRYYRNMNGDYHPTDDVMTITTIEDGTEIVFNKQNLITYIATAREYRKGGYWYERLTKRYSHQTSLINGILSPIPYATSIAAEDYKILSYNRNLVLWNEDQLIPALQDNVATIVNNIFHNDYLKTDDLFLPLMIEELYAAIWMAIHTIRIENCYSRHTHEFLIWSHIDSFGDFSQYKASMTKEQIMWLFENIAYVKNNAGQQYIFNKLMENILSKGGISLAKYDMVSSTEKQLEDLTPTPLYRRLNMNLLDSYGRAASYIDTLQLINKQVPLAKDNPNETGIYYEDALSKGRYSLHSELPTKVLESSMADYTNRHADTLMSVVYNEWIYLAANDLFQGKIIVVDPKSGKQIRLPVTDAYHVWRYLVETAKGEEPVYICPVRYNRVSKIIPPTMEEVIRIGGKEFIWPKLANDIRAIWEPVARFVAPDYLIQYAVEVYDRMWQHKKLYSQFYDLNMRARAKNATKTMYDSGITTLGTHTVYQDLLDVYYFDFSDYSAEDRRGFAWEIFKRITGWDTNTQPSMRVKQSDLLDIMMKLSSYTVHVIKEMSDGTGVTEIVDEIYVGDARWVGRGKGMTANLKNVQLTDHYNNEFMHGLSSLVKVIDKQPVPVKYHMSSLIKTPTNDRVKKVELRSGIQKAMKVIDYTHIRRVSVPPPEDDFVLPPTYYGVLQPMEDPALELPATYYGKLDPQ